ncbi:hypothetical protein [Pseudochrobactrum sp. XF203]|uniref:hypothetical protein n=1 Tax=Pseudochrobactrum sp. XF203 TaxID=2879116 RepID=UPI001CE2E54B|nr:hypothetical protein [Pseudochrobactrum sp. XF203]UCA44925.1 hypothetical protein LDL70_11195 [Pseudochrobactrum sp. XF203]
MQKSVLILLASLVLGTIFGFLDVSSFIADQSLSNITGYGIGAAAVTILGIAGLIRLSWVIAGAVLNGLLIAAFAYFASNGILTGEFTEQTVVATPLLMIILLPLPFWVSYAQTRHFEYTIVYQSAWNICWRVFGALASLFWVAIYSTASGISSDIVDPELMRFVPWLIGGAIAGVVAILTDRLEPSFISPRSRFIAHLVGPQLLLPLMAMMMLIVFFGTESDSDSQFSISLTLWAMLSWSIIATIIAERKETERLQGGYDKLGKIAVIAVLAFGFRTAWLLYGDYQSFGLVPVDVTFIYLTVIGLTYGFAYLWALTGGAAWAQRLRCINLVMALPVYCIFALALTDALSPLRVAAQQQVTMALTGDARFTEHSVKQLMKWGQPGADALKTLREAAVDKPELGKLLGTLLPEKSKPLSVPEQVITPAQGLKLRDQLIEQAVFVPDNEESRQVTRNAFTLMPDYLFQNYASLCAVTEANTGCTIYLADFLPQATGKVILIDSGKADPLRFQALQVNGTNSASLQTFVHGEITDEDKGGAMVAVAGCDVNAMQFGKALLLALDGFDKKKACQL